MRDSSPPESTRAVVTLCLGERTVVRCDDGLLAAEYAVFDTTDIVLEATDPVSVREKGYTTTAGEALARLSRANVTPGLAEQAARSLSLDVASSFARGPAARSVISHLGAQELFDGAIFRAPSSRYEGAWLDLATLSAQLGIAGASILLQALHLAAALAEVPPTTPLYLSTSAATRERLPGERTHSRIELAGAARIPEALARLGPNPTSSEGHPGRDRRMRRALLARVRERLVGAEASDRLRTHVEALDTALAPRTMSLGPLAYPQLQAIERQLATGDAQGVDQQLEELERDHGSPTGIRYLRARAALLRGDDPPRTVAELLAEIGREEPGFHQAVLSAARKWMATGQKNNARHFALLLARDPSAPDGDRLEALDILERTGTPLAAVPVQPQGPTYPSTAPAFPRQVASPPPPAAPVPHVHPQPLTPLSTLAILQPQPIAPGVHPPQPMHPGAQPQQPIAPGVPQPHPTLPTLPQHPSPPPATSPLQAPQHSMPPLHSLPPQHSMPPLQPSTAPLQASIAPLPAHPSTAPVGADPSAQPPFAGYPPPANWAHTNGVAPRWDAPPPNRAPAVEEYPAEIVDWPPAGQRPPGSPFEEPAAVRHGGRMFPRYPPELAESLPLPAGASESTLDPQQFPKTPLQVRVAMVRCSREIGRDYRIWYGKTLRCDVLAVDAMQEHLMRCCVGRPESDETVAWEIRRHGALLSEIIARALGGVWTDVGPSEPGYWTMRVPPGIRCWPIGRVHRFVAVGSRGRDLVAYYLDLEARVRGRA
ncbi:MAG TPA: hypothetical protein VEK07_16280 [Polyangiaceae bacterium]|nr:hypothetical protein [Polyangiaceae bacterium]